MMWGRKEREGKREEMGGVRREGKTR